MSENRAITVVSKQPPLVPRVLAGGILGADIGLFIGIVANHGVHAWPLFLATLVPSLFVAGVAALAAYAIQQRRSPLRRLNRDLIGIASMAERGLIDNEEYHTLKARIIEEYLPQRITVHSVVKPALWSALVCSLLPLIIAGSNTWWPNYVFLTAVLVPGAGAALLAAGGTVLAHQLQQRRWHPELPSGEVTEWEALGTRPSLPSKK